MAMHYDALGRTFETVNPLGQISHMGYDQLGRVTAMTQNYQIGQAASSDTNVTTQQVYDLLGRTTVMTDALGATVSTSYDGLGRPIATRDAEQRLTRSGYDGTGTQRWQQLPDGRFMVLRTDGLGRVIAAIGNYQDGQVAVNEPVDQDLITQTQYDVAGRKVRTTDPAGRVTAFAYDLRDHLRQVTENATATCLASATDCRVVTQYQYDRAGNRVVIIDANGHQRSFRYDAADQQIGATDALQQTTNWTYDRAGRPATQDDPRSAANNLTFGYDAANRVVSTTATNLGVPITAQYDALGRRTQLTDATGNTNVQYDALGRIKQVNAPTTGIVGYQYNARGERTQLTYPNGLVLGYTYRPDGQLDQVQQGSTTLADYAYDSVGRVQAVSRANGATTTYGYDRADRLQNLQTVVNATATSRFQYQTNRLGLRTVVTETLALPTSAPLLRSAPQAKTTAQRASAGGAQTNGTPQGDGSTFYDDVDTAVIYAGGGTFSKYNNISHAAGGNGTLSKLNKGQTASFTFSGSRISFLFSMGPVSTGPVIAHIAIKNSAGLVVNGSGSDIDQNTPAGQPYRRQVVKTWTMTPGTYTIEISNSPSTVGNGQVDIDGFTVDVAAATAGTYDDGNGLVRYVDAATWLTASNAGASSGAYHYSATTLDFARLTYNGKDVTVTYSRGPARGIAYVTIDGVATDEYNLYSASYAFASKTYVLSSSAYHSIHIMVSGTKQPTGATDYRVGVDGFTVSGSTAPPSTPLPTNTPLPTAIPPTATRTPTNTPVPPTATRTPTNTPVPPTATNTPTNTPVPPTATNTPTNTPVPPTATNTPTNTPTSSPTNTPVPPTATNTPTNTPVPPTATNTPTNTSVPPTATNTPTNTPMPPTATNTLVPPTATKFVLANPM